MPVQTNPVDELDGLKVALQGATTGAISRPVTVLHRDYDQFYEGPFPLIVCRMDHFTLRRISAGQTGLKGQNGEQQSFYAVEIQDAINARSTILGRVANAQSDVLSLIRAILAWFDHLPNQSMPVDGAATCYKAGEMMDFKMPRPFAQADGGDIRVVSAGLISVIGLPRKGLSI